MVPSDDLRTAYIILAFYGFMRRGHFSIPKQRMLFPELVLFREEHPLVRPSS